jgi:hypothetical protein
MKRVAIISLVLIFSGCTVPLFEKLSKKVDEDANAEVAELSQHEKAVIQAMFEYEAQGSKSGKPVIVLSSCSSADMLMDSLGGEEASDRIDAATIRSFRKANHRSHRWPTDLDSRYAIHLLSSQEMEKIWKDQEGWNRFYRTFPGAHGHITLSRAGFSADGRTALIYRGCQSDWLAGHGRLYLLRFERGRWKVTNEHIGGMWVS